MALVAPEPPSSPRAPAEKTKEYPNFYENIKEARMRLLGTIVLYDGIPHYVLTICSHNKDGIFRVYMEPLASKMAVNNDMVPYNSSSDDITTGKVMDEWLKANPNSSVVRKQMNSPLFNRFRPFELGMSNNGEEVAYYERQPTRKSEQGLTASMITETFLTGNQRGMTKRGFSGSIVSDHLRNCILGDYPSYSACIQNLNNPKIRNKGAAFHRHFALIRGPVDTLLLGYKDDIVGQIMDPYDGAGTVRLARSFQHLREVCTALKVFHKII